MLKIIPLVLFYFYPSLLRKTGIIIVAVLAFHVSHLVTLKALGGQ